MTAVAEQPTKKAKKKAQDINLSDATVDDLVTETAVPVEEKPEPEPGDADFDWQPQYRGEKVFTYTHPGNGDVVGLAAVSEKRQPSIGFLMDTRKLPQFEQVLDMVEFISSPDALTIVRRWVPTDLIEMFEEWSEWNKTAAGE